MWGSNPLHFHIIPTMIATYHPSPRPLRLSLALPKPRLRRRGSHTIRATRKPSAPRHCSQQEDAGSNLRGAV